MSSLLRPPPRDRRHCRAPRPRHGSAPVRHAAWHIFPALCGSPCFPGLSASRGTGHGKFRQGGGLAGRAWPRRGPSAKESRRPRAGRARRCRGRDGAQAPRRAALRAWRRRAYAACVPRCAPYTAARLLPAALLPSRQALALHCLFGRTDEDWSRRWAPFGRCRNLHLGRDVDRAICRAPAPPAPARPCVVPAHACGLALDNLHLAYGYEQRAQHDLGQIGRLVERIHPLPLLFIVVAHKIPPLQGCQVAA